MDFTQLFAGFLQPVAIGAAAVLALLLIVAVGTPRRAPAAVSRRPR
jgi:hypothetical protein